MDTFPLWFGRLAVTAFFAIAFLQSAADKWLDSQGQSGVSDRTFCQQPAAYNREPDVLGHYGAGIAGRGAVWPGGIAGAIWAGYYCRPHRTRFGHYFPPVPVFWTTARQRLWRCCGAGELFCRGLAWPDSGRHQGRIVPNGRMENGEWSHVRRGMTRVGAIQITTGSHCPIVSTLVVPGARTARDTVLGCTVR